MTTLETICIRCHRTHTPTLDDLRRGFWHMCPSCRLGPTRPQGQPITQRELVRTRREAA
jgi:hypothetical protein